MSKFTNFFIIGCFFLAASYGFAQVPRTDPLALGSGSRVDPEVGATLRTDPEAAGVGGTYEAISPTDLYFAQLLQKQREVLPSAASPPAGAGAAGAGAAGAGAAGAGAAGAGAAGAAGARTFYPAGIASGGAYPAARWPVGGGAANSIGTTMGVIVGDDGSPKIARQPAAGEAVASLIKKRPLIHVKVRVIEVQRADGLAVSSILDFVAQNSGGSSAIGNSNTLNGGNSNFTGGSRFSLPGLIDLGGMNRTAIGGGAGMLVNLTTDHINHVASLLSSEFNGDIITAPHVTTLDGELVVFSEGQKIPFSLGTNLVGQNSTNIQQFLYKHVGTYVSVVPKIVFDSATDKPYSQDGWYKGDDGFNPENSTIDLDIVVRLSDAGSVDVSSINAAGDVVVTPTTSEANVRAISNTVQVKNGHGVVIGGLISMREIETLAKTPVLGDIPYIGAMFRSKQTSRAKFETLILVEATVAEPDGAQVRAETERDFCAATQHLDSNLCCEADLYNGMYAAGLTGEYLPLPSDHEVDYLHFYNQSKRDITHKKQKTQWRDILK